MQLPFLRSILFLILKQESDIDQKEVQQQIAILLREKQPLYKTVKGPLQEFLLRFLEKHRDLPSFPAFPEFYTLMITLLPQRATSIGIDLQRPTKIQLPDTTSFIDFRSARSFIHLFDASQQIGLFFEQDWNPVLQKDRLEEASTHLMEVYKQKAFMSAVQENRLRAIANMWLFTINQEKKRLEILIENSSIYNTTTSSIANPFYPGNSDVGTNRLFVGRLDKAGELENYLHGRKKTGSLLLYGVKRMGKTSLLKQLPRLLSNRYIPVYYDLQGPNWSYDEKRMLVTMSEGIYTELQERQMPQRRLVYMQLEEAFYRSIEDLYHVFQQWLTEVEALIERSDKILLLNFDEFEELTSLERLRDSASTRFLQFLQSLTERFPHLVILLCGAHAFHKVDSPWARLFSPQEFRLSFLRPDEAHELLSRANRVTEKTLFDDSVIRKMIYVTAGHPYLLQALGSVVVSILITEQRTQAYLSDVERAVELVTMNLDPYFQELWMCSNEQQQCLSLLMKSAYHLEHVAKLLNMDVQATEQILQELQERDLVHYTMNGYQLTIPIFRKWMQQNT